MLGRYVIFVSSLVNRVIRIFTWCWYPLYCVQIKFMSRYSLNYAWTDEIFRIMLARILCNSWRREYAVGQSSIFLSDFGLLIRHRIEKFIILMCDKLDFKIHWKFVQDREGKCFSTTSLMILGLQDLPDLKLDSNKIKWWT